MSGVVATSGHGSVTQSASVALTGQVVTAGQGLLDDQRGQAFFAGQGTLSPVLIPTGITSQLITSAQGTVTPSQTTGDVTVHIGGQQQIDSFIGSVSPTAALSGQVITSAAGTTTPSFTRELTGSEIVSSIGTVTAGLSDDDTFIQSASGSVAPDYTRALVGSAITSAQGSFSLGDKQEPLGSQIQIIAQGSLIANRSVALAGQSITGSQYPVGAPGFAELTGQSATVEQGFLGIALAISGQEITSAQGTIVGVPGLVALVGESVSVQQGTMTPSGTQWIPEGQPTTTWTPPASPSSSWTRKGGPSTSWNRKT
jgi:hypothetical protein